RYRWDERVPGLALDDGWRVPYRTRSDQSYGWDPVISGGNVWFMDNGDGAQNFRGSMRGVGVAPGPVHLVRASVDGTADFELVEVSGRPHGFICNPPVHDAERGVVVAFDAGNGVMAAWRHASASPLALLWRRELGHAAHMLRFPDTGELVVGDFGSSGDDAVVLDIETGRELGRAATGSLVQSATFPAPGWDGDFYRCSFTTLTRVSVGA
ncbi:MAG TPA: hypothetical protein VMQ81_03885, partial [Acidimicrobiia bacterium]|nr:hypothetical protein [Acidimicrobiia bacterium]